MDYNKRFYNKLCNEKCLITANNAQIHRHFLISPSPVSNWGPIALFFTNCILKTDADSKF